ncbi:MAG: methionyl-tRNA formyltransferase [Flavobacteriales bacterium]|nr:methionyl-tRNA formyltransferase [Flavobacteriales bacterium]
MLRIIFMGTPGFAVPTLEKLLEAGKQIVAVITAPDRPAGRGQQIHYSEVKQCALKHGIMVLQPEKLKDPAFLETYYALKPDLNIVVAFRMLPESVWAHPKYGTINLHASLLPQYRGAAPINWAIMNGEKQTGLTTFFIEKEIDTGKIILQQKMDIGDEETAGELHDRMMFIGAEMVLKTVEMIEKGEVHSIDQKQIIENEHIILKPAPKIFKDDCKINWNQSLTQIHNQIRGLSPYPSAFTILIGDNYPETPLKIYKSSIKHFKNTEKSGTIGTDGKKHIWVNHSEGALYIEELQLAGRKRLKAEEFLRGFPLLTGVWKVK